VLLRLESGNRPRPSRRYRRGLRQLTWLDPRTQSGSWGLQRLPYLPVWHCKTVGGTTVHWTASTPRLEPWEVRARTVYGEMAGSSQIDWPISYEELLRYYEMAERRMGVTRRNGVPGLPAIQKFQGNVRGRKKLGYKRVHTGHMAINSRAFDGRGFCLQQGFLRPRMQDGREMEHPVHGNTAGRRRRVNSTCAWSARQRGSSTGRTDVSTRLFTKTAKAKNTDRGHV